MYWRVPEWGVQVCRVDGRDDVAGRDVRELYAARKWWQTSEFLTLPPSDLSIYLTSATDTRNLPSADVDVPPGRGRFTRLSVTYNSRRRDSRSSRLTCCSATSAWVGADSHLQPRRRRDIYFFLFSLARPTAPSSSPSRLVSGAGRLTAAWVDLLFPVGVLLHPSGAVARRASLVGPEGKLKAGFRSIRSRSPPSGVAPGITSSSPTLLQLSQERKQALVLLLDPLFPDTGRLYFTFTVTDHE